MHASSYLSLFLSLRPPVQVTPEQGINEASFMIRVKDPSLIDYENVKLFNFTLVARLVKKILGHFCCVQTLIMTTLLRLSGSWCPWNPKSPA